jgi:hypothetical protein
MPRTLLLSAVLLLPLVGCDKATPVAPSGTTLAIAANPSTVSLNGTSTVTVIGRRPNGSPLIPGTEIQFSTNLGSIEPAIATTDSNGQVTAIFRADNRAGAATITASTGTSSSPGPGPTPNPSPTPTTGTSVLTEEATGGVSVTTTIQVGESAGTKPTLVLSASPNSIPVQESARITVIARNADGSPVAAGRTIILTTTLGTLSPDRPTTKSDGTATSTLSSGSQSGTATITAILGSSEAATTTVTIRDAATAISLQANPASISSAGGAITLTAFVTNSQGQALQGAPVIFETDRGTLDDSQGTTVFTTTSGTATKTLNLKASDLPSGVQSFQVRAKTPNGSGQLIIATAIITVTQ